VYPGDPEVEIKQVHILVKQGWNLRTLFLNTHLGTHVNVPSHMVENGGNLDDSSLDNFCGPAIVYGGPNLVKSGPGIISYENLVNTEKLPGDKQFMFYGYPLKIKDGDGSPVRAVAVI